MVSAGVYRVLGRYPTCTRKVYFIKNFLQRRENTNGQQTAESGFKQRSVTYTFLTAVLGKWIRQLLHIS